MKVLKFRKSLIPVALLASSLWGNATLAQTGPHNWAKQATFIFEGELEKAGAKAQSSDLPPGNLVRVVTIFYVSSNVSVRPGDSVVVQPATPEPLQPGKRAIFYTNGWVYGSRLAVRELGHVSQDKTVEQWKQEITAAKSEAEDDRIHERLAGAELVLAGRVESCRPYGNYKETTPVSEHDPDWWLAEVTVAQALKGRPEGRTVLVAFPNSFDVMWASSPKFKPGQEGIWILARPQNLQRIFLNLGQPVYSAISPRDYYLQKDLERIIRLLKAPN